MVSMITCVASIKTTADCTQMSGADTLNEDTIAKQEAGKADRAFHSKQERCKRYVSLNLLLILSD